MFVVIAVALSSRLGMRLAIDIRGPQAFKDPGGWRIPFGEVMVIGFALLPVFLIGWSYLAVHGA